MDDQERPDDSRRVRCRETVPLADSVDRRRSGRLEDVSRSLIPLLRFKPSPEQVAARRSDPVASDHAEDDDDLRVARGIAFGLATSGLFWVALGALRIRF